MSRRALVIVIILFAALLRPTVGEEGMYPITSLAQAESQGQGAEDRPGRASTTPKGTSLIDGIVSLGGCSASFVSPEGLIITNHHCVFGAVQAASTVEKDYLTNGFLAATRPDEIRARGMTARITEEMRDVTADVMSVVNGRDGPDRAREGDRRRASPS